MAFGIASMRRPRFWMAAAAVLAVYAAAGFWLVPKLLDSTLRDSVATRYGRKLQLGEIRFNPFSFELDVRNLQLPDADGGRLLSFERLYVNLGLRSVVRGGLAFQAIVLDAPHARIVRRRDGSLNLQDLAGPPSAEPEPDSQLVRLWIDRLAVNAGQAEVTDETRSAPLRLALIPVSFNLHDFSSRGDGNAYIFSALSSLGEELRWRGTFGLAPLASRGSFELRHVRAKTLADVALEGAPYEISGGELALQGQYDVAQRGDSWRARVTMPRLSLRSLGLRTRGAEQDAVVIPALDVVDAKLDAAAKSVSVEQVAFTGPRVLVARGKDGVLDLMRWVGSRESTPTPTPTVTSTSTSVPWTVSVPQIQVGQGEIQLTDHGPGRAAQLSVGALELQVRGFAMPARGPLDVQLNGQLNETGRLSARGPVNLEPLTAELILQLEDLPLTAAQPYLDDHTSLIVRDGRARLEGQLQLAADGGVTFTGKAGVDALHTQDAALQEDFIKWRSLDLLGLRVQTQPLSVTISELVANEPYARVIVAPDSSVNIQQVLHARAADAQGLPHEHEHEHESGHIALEIRTVRVEGGSLNFTDLSLKPSFTTGLEQLRGTIVGLSSEQNARADVKLEGRVGRYSPVSITGKLNYFAAAKHTDLHMRFKNMELTAFSPYSGKFAGYKIERGKLDLDLHYLIDRRRLAAQHKIVMKQLQLGAAVESRDATSLPVKLAVALLKDKNGVIDLDLPVSGNLDDPHFKLGPLIWKVVTNLLSKAVSAPFALLGSLFGGGDELAYIEFAPGDGSLLASSREKLKNLARALEERPTLNLDVPLLVAPQLDRNALLESRFLQKLEARATRELGAKTPAPAALAKLRSGPPRYRSLLERMYRESFGKAPQIPPPPTAASAAPPPKPAAPRQYPFVDGPAHGALARRAVRAQPSQNVQLARQPLPPIHGLGHSVRAPAPPAPKAPVLPDGYAIGWLEGQLKTRIPVQEQELSKLAQARAQSVQRALLDGTGIDPSRVFVIEAPPLTAGTALRMQLALH